MKVPYKINRELLEFIQDNNIKYDLLINKFKPHKYAHLDKRTTFRENELRSHNSAVIMQENILDIVGIYRNFSKIYFPVRLDSRGRLYPEPAFFHYQSNELPKALLLFAKPSVIHRSDKRTIDNMKIACVNSYGGVIGKKSDTFKIN
jgi:DNA-directed RNA polymerase